MFRGTGNKNNPISGNAALLSNIKKLGGFEKFKRELTRVAADAAVEKYITQSLGNTAAPKEPTKPVQGATRKTTDKNTSSPSSIH